MNQSQKEKVFKVMYLLNVFGAGIPGFLIVCFPEFGEQNVLWESQDYGVMTIVGSIWLAVGLCSILGFFQPYKFLAIFVMQLIYKSIWLLSFVLPAILNHTGLPPAANITIAIFILLIIEFVLFVRVSDFRMLKVEKA